MDAIVLRGRITSDGKIELLDPLPEDFDTSGEISVMLSETPLVYETVNEYGDRVIVDETDGSVSPLEPLTVGELLDALAGLWADRRDEIPDSTEWVKEQRHKEQERSDPWQGRTLS